MQRSWFYVNLIILVNVYLFLQSVDNYFFTTSCPLCSFSLYQVICSHKLIRQIACCLSLSLLPSICPVSVKFSKPTLCIQEISAVFLILNVLFVYSWLPYCLLIVCGILRTFFLFHSLLKLDMFFVWTICTKSFKNSFSKWQHTIFFIVLMAFMVHLQINIWFQKFFNQLLCTCKTLSNDKGDSSGNLVQR